MKERILGTYKITYPKYKVTQFKDLISHDDYVNDIKVKEAEIAELEKNTPLSNTTKRKIKELKKYIIENYGDCWFTDGGLLYQSINNNGIMSMPSYQGGDIEVILEKIL